jgi:hypothetical protein
LPVCIQKDKKKKTRKNKSNETDSDDTDSIDSDNSDLNEPTNSSEKKPRSSKKLTTEEAAHTRLVTKVRIHDFRFFFILKLILSFI